MYLWDNIKRHPAAFEVALFYILYGIWLIIGNTQDNTMSYIFPTLFILGGFCLIRVVTSMKRRPLEYAVAGAFLTGGTLWRIIATFDALCKQGESITTSSELISSMIVWLHIAILATIIMFKSANAPTKNHYATQEIL